jgi:cytoskeletal protein CcmA (bactofilin family)
MFMFALTRKPDPNAAIARPAAELSSSRLGPGVTVKGVIEVEGELIIAGVITGRIAALRLIIDVDGSFEGDVVAREVIIAGRLTGRVFAPAVTVEASAIVEGRIFHHIITVSRGAQIDGRMPWRPVNFFETLKQLPEPQP